MGIYLYSLKSNDSCLSTIELWSIVIVHKQAVKWVIGMFDGYGSILGNLPDSLMWTTGLHAFTFTNNPKDGAWHNQTMKYVLRNSQIWGFPEIGVPPNHPFLDGIFPCKPTILDTPIYGNPHMSSRTHLWNTPSRHDWPWPSLAQPRDRGNACETDLQGQWHVVALRTETRRLITGRGKRNIYTCYIYLSIYL